MPNSIKAIIFDMDGVIIDSEPIYFEIENKLFEELGINISVEEHYSFVGMTSEGLWRKISEKYLPTLNLKHILKKNEEKVLDYFENIDKLTPMDNLIGFLEDLKKNDYKIGLASSSIRKLIDIILLKLNIKSYFNVIVSGNDIDNSKPSPDIYLKAAKLLNIHPQNCLAIEDAANGLIAAKKAGMFTVGFINPNSGNQDMSFADMKISSFKEINSNVIKNFKNKIAGGKK